MPSPYELRPDDTHGGGDVRRRRDGPRRWRTRWWRARWWWRNAYPGYAALTKVLAALPQTLTLLSFQPFLRHSPLSGTLHSSRPGVPVPHSPAGRAFPFRSKPIETPQKVRLSFAPTNNLAPGRPGGRGSSGRTFVMPRGRRPARGWHDRATDRQISVRVSRFFRSHTAVQTYGFGIYTGSIGV